jgi:hypothetical protein
MKTNIKHYIFSQLWEATRDILPVDIDICGEFSEEQIDTKKFEELFPDVALSTVALISTNLAEQGLIISLQNLCDFKLTEAFERSLIVFTADLSLIDDNFRSKYIVNSTEINKTKIQFPESENFELKPIKWSELLNKPSSENFYQKIEALQQEYPEAIIYGLYDPWQDIAKEIKHKGLSFDSAQEEKIKDHYSKSIDTSDLLLTIQECIDEKLDELKNLTLRLALSQASGSIKIGPNEKISIKVNLDPIRLNEDFSIEESAELLNVGSGHWICDTDDMVLVAESKDIPGDAHDHYCNTEIKGDFFVFPNCSESPAVDTNAPFYVIPMHRLGQGDVDDLLRHITNQY